jgi:hypothetical protein
MKKISISFFTAFLLIVIITNYACRKSDADNDYDLTSSEDVAGLHNEFLAVVKYICTYADSSAMLRAACPTVTVDSIGTASWSKILNINFDTSGCNTFDGATCKGNIIAYFSRKLSDSLTSITGYLSNYKRNNLVLGVSSFTLTNLGRNTIGNFQYDLIIPNASVTGKGGTAFWKANLKLEKTSGTATIGNPSDDAYLISGTAEGRAVNANTFTAKITTPLQIDFACAYIEKGVIELSPANLALRTIDFGNGTCDNKANVKIKGNTNEISF